MTGSLPSIGACERCGSKNVEWYFGWRIPPWCRDCKTQIDGLPYRVAHEERTA